MTRLITIETGEDCTGIAPTNMRWQACYNGFDLGCKVGWGATEEAAIIDLVRNYDLPTEPEIFNR